MTETKSSAMIYPRLCLAYFCQFAIWGAWAGALGGYTDGILGMSPSHIGWLYSAIPLGAVIAPLFIGPIADRYFAAQKVVALLHLIGGAALIGCGWLCMTDKQTFPLLMGLMLLSGTCFMPTISLVNSIVFKHLPDAGKAPLVFVFGTLGWIAVNLFIAAFCGGAATPNFFYVGGGVSIFLAIYCLSLPNTPPKPVAAGEKSDALGLGALSLFKDFSFFIFVFCAFCASIPACNYFFPSQVPFLSQRGYPSPVALTTVNQISELLFMAALPFFISKIGLKNVLLIGMASWIGRYICFSQNSFPLAIVGLLLHGFSYSFLYVAAYMYADKKAPDHLKASTQSLMVFLLLGVGQVLGGQMYGKIGGNYESKFLSMPVSTASIIDTEGKQLSGPDANAPIPSWSTSEGSAFQYLDLAAQVNKLMGRTGTSSKVFDLGKSLGDKPFTAENLAAIPDDQMILEGAKFTLPNPADEKNPIQGKGTISYTKDDMMKIAKSFTALKTGKKVEEISDADVNLTRDDWFAAQARDWKMIYLIPSAFVGIFFVIFLVLGKNPKETAEEKKG